MLKVIPNLTRRFLTKQHFLTLQSRLFLSESFKLDNAWKDRLQSPILKKIDVNDMFYELDNQFQHFAFASALDIDLFVNSINDETYFDEVEDIVYKLRLSPEAINILPSTQHAIIRLYLEFNKTDELVRILDDRLNYGIFSDDYCSLLMMDTFIKSGNFKDAAKIGILSMLQEDVSNPLVKYMSLYSCHKYLDNPVPWNQEESEYIKDDDDIVKIRVRYIRNPYFDDHFDLVDPKYLIGKTFAFIGSQINDHIGRTYTLLGLLLHDKLEQAKEHVISISKENHTIVKDGLTMAINLLDEKSKSEGNDNIFKGLVSELKEQLSNLTNSQVVVQDGLLTLVENKLKECVSKSETSEIDKQLQLYKEWEENRKQRLLEQIAKISKEKQLAEIQHQKQILKEKEEELFFFDNEEKLDLIIEEKEKEKEKQREIERKKEEAKLAWHATNVKKETEKKQEMTEPPLESFFDENIPMKLIKTKL